jgi:catechol 2,3-dioxygenase-like lactoylglutathione lyase family enzyme
VSVDLNHLVIPARDKDASAVFLAQMLGLPGPISFGPFMAVQVGNGVTLVYVDADGDITPLHYAFLVAETTFDEIFGRIREGGLVYWADHARRQAGEINTREGGRGVYFDDPNGHLLEILTRPHGTAG